MENRHSIRLKGWDYSSKGYYFVTIDTWHKIKYFGEIKNGMMILNENGEILKNEIENTPIMRKNIIISIFQIMPDHIHFILGINDGLTQKLGCIIRGIKMATTVKINDKNKHPIWQRNYFEMIIRNESDFNRIAKYIINNPIKYGAHDNAPVQKNL